MAGPFFVRKTGSNSNNGTSPSTAWLTLTYALTAAGGNPAGGSIIYVGGGVYRETVAPTVSGASLSTTYDGTNGLSLATILATGLLTVTSITGLVAPPAGYYNTFQLVTSAGNVQGTYTGLSASGGIGGNPALTGIKFHDNATVTSAATVASSAVCIIGSPTWVIGDTDGAQTGDAGEVTLSNFTTNDTTAPNSTLLAFGTQSYLSFAKMTMVQGATTAHTFSTNAAGGMIGCLFVECTFNSLLGVSTSGGFLSLTSPTTGLAMNIVFDRCIHGSTGFSIALATTASGSGDYDALILIRNIGLLLGNVSVTATGTSTYKGGGVRIVNSSFISKANTAVTAATATYLSTAIPCEVHNSLLIAGASGTALNAATSGQLVESYNNIYAGTPRTNVSAGTGSQTNAYAPLLELGHSRQWAGVFRQFMAPDGPLSPLLGFGSDGSGSDPTVDWMNRVRPSGGQSTKSAVGYAELHDFQIEDTSVYNDSPASPKIVGPGDAEFDVPVDAVATTFSIYVYAGSGYGGSNMPTVTLLASGELGVTAQTLTYSASLGTWQQLTFSPITPTAAGFVKIRVTSFDTSATAPTNFDTFAAT